jgi:hypothetical protein
MMTSHALAAEIGTRSAPAAPAAAAGTVVATKAKNNGVAATIRTDGAMVYSKPDFDADVLTQMKQGDHVRVSSGTIGDFAKFHKVRVGSVLGWVAEIDVQVDGAPKKRDHKRGAGKNGKKPTKAGGKKEKKPFTDTSQPLFFTKYVGAIVGLSDFVESISGVDSQESLLVYGIKITGPDILINGPIMDFNVLLHYGAPAYYNALSSTKPSGFVIMSDALFLYPLLNKDKAIVTFGLGPLAKYSSFNVTSGGDIRILAEFDVGVSLALAGAIKFDKIAVRLEAKYMIEKHTEKLFQLAVQQQF